MNTPNDAGDETIATLFDMAAAMTRPTPEEADEHAARVNNPTRRTFPLLADTSYLLQMSDNQQVVQIL